MQLAALSFSSLFYSLTTVIALSIACAMLSVLVVSRRWAFIGEGISHSGFGGAGTAWLLALIFPGLDQPWLPYTCVIVFCLLTAAAIAFLSFRQRVNSDAAIGIFMVASLAWGFLAAEIYRAHFHANPTGFEDLLFGQQMGNLSAQYAISTVMLSTAIVITLIALNKEILYYCFDPVMAEASGVRAGLIHHLLIILVALTIVLGVRVAGSVLVTALLVLPGATALLISDRLRTVIIASIIIAAIGAASGVLLNSRWRFVPAGPAIVLTLFLLFVGTCIATRLRRGSFAG